MKPSASKTALLMACQYWARDDVQSPPDKPGKSAKLGTAVHSLIANRIHTGIEPEFDTDDWILRRYTSARQWLKIACPWVSSRPLPEVAFAMTHIGTVKLGTMVARDAYPSDAFCGTADLIHVDDDGACHLKDWKTGAPSDAEAWQLRTLAAMSFEAGTPIKTGKAIYLTDGAPRFSDDYLVGTDPAEDAKTIRRTLAQVASSEPNRGHWCKSMWCPMRSVCNP